MLALCFLIFVLFPGLFPGLAFDTYKKATAWVASCGALDGCVPLTFDLTPDATRLRTPSQVTPICDQKIKDASRASEQKLNDAAGFRGYGETSRGVLAE